MAGYGSVTGCIQREIIQTRCQIIGSRAVDLLSFRPGKIKYGQESRESATRDTSWPFGSSNATTQRNSGSVFLGQSASGKKDRKVTGIQSDTGDMGDISVYTSVQSQILMMAP